MQTYFDLLPKELNEIILFHLIDIQDILNIIKVGSVFGLIMKSHYFWKNKLIYRFPEINLSVISSHLLNKKSSINKLIFDYVLVERAIIGTYEDFDSEIRVAKNRFGIPLITITNFDLLGINDESFLILYNNSDITDRDARENVILMNFVNENTLSMSVLNYTQNISYKHALDLMFHAYCNGSD